MDYVPWCFAALFACLVAASRILNNRSVKARSARGGPFEIRNRVVPVWVSGLYLLSIVGLIVCAFWSVTIAWWAPALVVAAYFLQMVLIPSAILAAAQQARHEKASAAFRAAVKGLDRATEQLRNAIQEDDADFDVNAVVRQAAEAMKQAQTMIDALPDPQEKFGMLMVLQERAERFQEVAKTW
jgi:Flp pilus assembly protein TadB